MITVSEVSTKVRLTAAAAARRAGPMLTELRLTAAAAAKRAGAMIAASELSTKVTSTAVAAKRALSGAETARAIPMALLAVGVVAAMCVTVGCGQLQNSASARESQGAVARASRGDVIVMVRGVGRIVESGVATEITLPTAVAAAGAAGAGATGTGSGAASPSGGTSAPAVTSGTAVFPKTSGHLIRFFVEPGQHVAAGQPLALLSDNGLTAAAILQAQNDIATALVELKQKRTSDPLKGLPPTPAELTAARGAVTSARFRLAQLLRGARPADIATARLDLRRAEADLETLVGGSAENRASAIRLAEDTVELAQQRLDKLLAPASAADVAAAQADLKRAQADLAVLLQPNSHALPAEIEAAKAAVEAAQRKLERLLGPPDSADVTAARVELERAQAELRRLKAGPSPVALAAARQAVETARVRLAQLLAPPLKSDVASAQFDVLKAEADFAVLRTRGAPASSLDVALARLKVVGTRLRLGSAEIGKPLLTVRAASSGTVTALLTVPGAPVDPLTPIASVADLDHLAVSVDLSEFDVARVRSGLRAIVSVDALGGKSYSGTVLSTALTGTNASGVVTFPVRVGIAHARGLRPGMNVSVRIIVARRLGVVQVPVEAVSRDDEDRATVTVADADGETSLRRVTLGLASNKNVQIVKGLRVGETVVLPQSKQEEE